MTAATSERAYPVAPAQGDEDPRFTHGLLFDVAQVIAAHGYPAITSGPDLVELHLALFRFLHQSADQAA